VKWKHKSRIGRKETEDRENDRESVEENRGNQENIRVQSKEEKEKGSEKVNQQKEEKKKTNSEINKWILQVRRACVFSTCNNNRSFAVACT
jgi:hypothetical protein